MTSIGADLGITVRHTAHRAQDPYQLFAQNQQWAKGAAATIIRRCASSWSPECHRDWQIELVTHLWFASGRYEQERGDWRSWAYKVMLNRMQNLIDSAIYRARAEKQAELENRASLLSGAPDPGQVALDKAIVSSVATELRRMADSEAQEAYRRDNSVLMHIAKCGADYGTWVELQQALGTDRAGILRCRARIAEAMVAVGIVEQEAQ